MTEAEPSREKKAESPFTRKAQPMRGVDFAQKCIKAPTCVRPRDASRDDGHCAIDGAIEDYQNTGDASLLPNGGLCSPSMKGVLCRIGAHDKACPDYKPPRPREQEEKLSPRVRAHKLAMGELDP